MSSNRPESAGPPDHAAAPSSREELSEWLEQQTPDQARVAFAQGDEIVEADVVDVDVSRGAELAELHFEDGRHTTVRVGRDVEWIAERR